MAHHEHAERKKKEWRDELFGIIALIVSVLAVIFTALQYKEARTTRIIVHEDAERARMDAQAAAIQQADDARRSADAASKSANAALSSANTQSALLRYGQRAYVAVQRVSIGVEGPESDGLQNARINVQIKAIGPSPALKLQVAFNCNFIEDYMDDIPPLMWPRVFSPDIRSNAGILLPGTETRSYDCWVHEHEVKPVNYHFGGTAVLLGTIKYEDIFGESHETDLCFLRDRGALPTDLPKAPNFEVMTGCKTHNTMR